jgi:hypothetical protein
MTSAVRRVSKAPDRKFRSSSQSISNSAECTAPGMKLPPEGAENVVVESRLGTRA